MITTRIEEGQPLSSFTNHHFRQSAQNRLRLAREQSRADAREHLTPDDVEQLIVGTRQAGGRVVERDALSIIPPPALVRAGLEALQVIIRASRRFDVDRRSLQHAGYG